MARPYPVAFAARVEELSSLRNFFFLLNLATAKPTWSDY